MKKLLLPLICFFFGSAAWAQADYFFSTFTDEYVEIPEENLAVNGTWDDPNYTVPIGFDFNMMGTTTGFLHASDDFYEVVFNPNPDQVLWDLLWVTTLDVIDAGYANDTFESPISYITEGEPGSQIFKIQWRNVGLYDEYADNGTANNKLNFQLWLYEGSNDIEVRWGPNTVKETFYVTEVWNSCGLLNDASSDQTFDGGLFLAGDAATPDANVILSMNDFFDAQLLGLPENGRVYRFEAGALSINAAEAADANVRLFPTVVQNFVHVDGLQPGAFSVEILSTDGRLVQQFQHTAGQTVNLSSLQSGMYIIVIQQDKNVHTSRILKE